MSTLPMTGASYTEALALVLRSGSQRKTASQILDHFPADEREGASAALDALVKSGKVDFDGNVYSLSRSR